MVLDGLINLGFSMLAFAATWLACGWMMRTGIVDAPDGGRKMQDRPVPRLGGAAMAIGSVIGAALGAGLFAIIFAGGPTEAIPVLQALVTDAAPYASVFAFTAAAFLIGLWDDIWSAKTKLKLAFIAIACLVAAWSGLVPDALNTPWGALAAPGLLIAGSALWLLVFTNAANFMDGSNGLTIGCLAIMLSGLGVTAYVEASTQIPFWAFAMLGAMAGFLVQNLRGKIYAGDAGALGLGALFASLGLSVDLEVWTVATLALPFLVDVLLTLVWRAKHRRNVLEAHLDHAYQRLIASGWTHLETAILYWGLSATAAVLAYIGARAGGAAPFAVFWTLALSGGVVWILHRRAAKRDDLSN